MIIHTKELFFERINQLYQRKTPFFFLADYSCQQMEVTPIADLRAGEVALQTPGFEFGLPGGLHLSALGQNDLITDTPLIWAKSPVDFSVYEAAFQQVQAQIKLGNSYLTNLTFSTPVKTNRTLAELYKMGVGKYKLYQKDRFVHFSPEPFVKIEAGKIGSFPMKGTMDADMPEAFEAIMESEKEKAEQYTIVDLIRNDMSQVATDVRVDAFRYVEKLNTNQKNLNTVSSKITGNLRPAFVDRPGDILAAMLPAGSICGAPKQSTLEIIDATESHHRGFYTGVWGIFDGQLLDSCVIIRYIEQDKTAFQQADGLFHYIFKSGGGITSMSDAKAEYQEMIDKVYVPLY